MRSLLASVRERVPSRGALLGVALAGIAACSGCDAPTAVTIEPELPPPAADPPLRVGNAPGWIT